MKVFIQNNTEFGNLNVVYYRVGVSENVQILNKIIKGKLGSMTSEIILCALCW